MISDRDRLTLLEESQRLLVTEIVQMEDESEALDLDGLEKELCKLFRSQRRYELASVSGEIMRLRQKLRV